MASRVLLIALEVMNQGCLQRPTQVRIPEDVRDDGLVSQPLASTRVAFPEMLPFIHKGGMKPRHTCAPTSTLLPTLHRDTCKIAARACACAHMEPALVFRPALIIKHPLPTDICSSFTCQTTALSKYQQNESGPCSV